jgi:PPP family 3-phenylpropionic acid transporter
VPAASPRSSDLKPWFGLAAFYAASFAVLAIWMQFVPLWLHEARGLTKAQLPIVLSAQTLSRTIAGPLWAWRVDRSRRPRTVLRVLAFASVGAFALFGAFDSIVLLWVASFLFGCVYSPMHPILDALAMQQATRSGFGFGRLRMVGSVSFLCVILATGWWLEREPADTVFAMLLVCLGATSIASLGLPRGAPAEPAEGETASWRVLRSVPFVLLLIASALIQGSHSAYYTLSTVHWVDHGIGVGDASVLWAEAIVAEIALFFVARRSIDRLRPTTVLMLGGAGAVVRWCVLASTTSFGWLLATNWLHAFSFAATYLGALRALERRVPEQYRATAQGLLGAASSGVGMVLGALLASWAYERWAGRVFFTMAALAAVGVGLSLILRTIANRYQATEQASTPARPA